MIFETPLVHGYLIKRYKRFLADVKLDDGREVTAHCTNSGSMKSCLEDNAEVYLTPVNDPKRRTKFTWEMIKMNGDWVGVNTSNPNKLALELVRDQIIPDLDMYNVVKREVKFDESRLDLLAENATEKCAIEVKNVTMKDGTYARFPDAKTERGLKHLHTLIRLKKEGYRSVMLYVIQRSDVDIFAPAKEIDSKYSEALLLAYNSGVEVVPIQVKVTPTEIDFARVLPFEL